jgi:ELWxxDGT repeat protein
MLVERQSAGAAAQPVDPEQLVASGGKLYFVAAPDDGLRGETIWVTDGTASGTMRLTSGSATLSDPDNLVDVGGTLFFTANPDPAKRTVELFTTDGTLAGTQRVDVDLVASNSGVQGQALPDSVNHFTTDGTRLYFAADDTLAVSLIPGSTPDDRHGAEVWVSDGTTAGTFVLDSSAVPTRVGIDPSGLSPTGASINFADSVFFSAQSIDSSGVPGAARILWQSTTTNKDANPVLVAGTQTTIAEPDELVAFAGTQFYVDAQGALFCRSDWRDGAGRRYQYADVHGERTVGLDSVSC